MNADIHSNLIALGYVHTHYEESYEDVGTPESGPELAGGPEFDEYESDTDRIIIDHEGRFGHHEMRDLAQEEAEKMMCP